MDWYSLEEATKFLSDQGELVNKGDLIRSAMDGRIALSVLINGSVKAQLAVMRSFEDAEIFFFERSENPLHSAVELNKASYEAGLKYLTNQSLSLIDEEALDGLGRDFFVRFHGVETSKGVVTPLEFDGLYVELAGVVSIDGDNEGGNRFLARAFSSLYGTDIGTAMSESIVVSSSCNHYIVHNYSDSDRGVLSPFPEGSKLGLKLSDLESISACSMQAEKVDANSTKRKAKRRSPKDDPDSYANHIGRLVKTMYTELGRVPKLAEVKDRIEALCKDDQEINYLAKGARYIIWGDERGIDSVKGAINDAIKALKNR